MSSKNSNEKVNLIDTCVLALALSSGILSDSNHLTRHREASGELEKVLGTTSTHKDKLKQTSEEPDGCRRDALKTTCDKVIV